VQMLLQPLPLSLGRLNAGLGPFLAQHPHLGQLHRQPMSPEGVRWARVQEVTPWGCLTHLAQAAAGAREGM
jgi:hypothetical protein